MMVTPKAEAGAAQVPSTALPTTGEDSERRGPGRPRDASIDDAILEATRQQLVSRGYSRLTIGEIAAKAGVSRPTLYRRWRTKLELVSDALDYGLRNQEAAYAAAGDPRELRPREAFDEAVRRVDPCWFNPHAVVLQGNFIGETDRAPELLSLLAERAVNPRVGRLEEVIIWLRDAGHVRSDVDVRTVSTMCFGAFFGAHLRGERDHAGLAADVADTMWRLIGTAG